MGGAAAETLDWELKQGILTKCGETGKSNRSSSYSDISYSLTEAEANSITDYANLRIHVAGTCGALEHIRVTQVYLECPEAVREANAMMVMGVGN